MNSSTKPQLRVYTAARFSRQAEMRRHAKDLRDMGYLCDPRWLGGTHNLPRDAPEDDPRGGIFAQHDVDDLKASQIVICFTEPKDTIHTRGGRHVELGLALAWKKRILIVGPRENVFTYLPQCEHFKTWRQAKSALAIDADTHNLGVVPHG